MWPLDRVVARHASAFADLRNLGMTWRGIAGLLVRAGARRADGKLISSDQLRVSFARFSKNQTASGEKSPATRKARRARIATDAPSVGHGSRAYAAAH